MPLDPTTADPPVEVVVNFVVDGGFYPRAADADPTLQYWKAMAVMAATLRVVGAEWPVTVSTNSPPTDPGVRDQLERHGVRFRDTPYRHRPPEGYYDRFSGTFYLLDALADAIDRAPSRGRVLVIDPDCVWVNDPAPVTAAVDADPDAILAYEVTYTPGQPAVGLTQEELGTFFNEIGERRTPARAPYAGGEFLFGERDRLAQLLPHLEHVWDESLRRFHAGERVRANLEEHALSYALGQLGWNRGTANPFVKRMWTKLPPERNVRGNEESLVAWHCLTEKGRGLSRLYDDVVAEHPALREPGPAYRRHLARRLRVELSWPLRVKGLATQAVYGRSRPYPVEW